jgi:tRNA(His) 5'-end guanylyltransferase
MQFKNLEDKCLYYRGLADYKLLPGSYVIVMLDGRSFSKLIKNKFEKPFDDNFIGMMNETAKYVCENVQGCKLAYVQSDEISLVLTDFDTPTTDAFFGYRLCKMQSIIASLATAKFNQLMLSHNLEKHSYDKLLEDGADTLYSVKDAIRTVDNATLYQFDCKCWNVPNINDVFAWFLYRQIDCVRNSKQQAAQAYLSHSDLLGLDTDAQIQLLNNEKGIDWNNYPMTQKYGRFIWKRKVLMTNVDSGELYHRHKWLVQPAFPLMGENGRDNFFKLEAICSILE